MTLRYCQGEKFAAICAQIGEEVLDLLAASLMSDALTALAGVCVFGVCTFSLSGPAVKSILATRWIYVGDAVLMLTLETVKFMLTPSRSTELYVQI